MPKQLLKRPSLPSRRRPNYGTEGKIPKRITTDCKAGIVRARNGKDDAPEIRSEGLLLEIDFEATQVRVKAFKDNTVIDPGLYDGGTVEEPFKPTIVAPVFGGQVLEELGGEALGFRIYESGSFFARQAFERVDDEAFGLKPEPGLVPVVELMGFEEVKSKAGPCARPRWKVVDWAPRRQEFVDYAAALGIYFGADEDLNDDLEDLLPPLTQEAEDDAH